MGNHRILFNFTHERCLAESELRKCLGRRKEIGREARREDLTRGVKSGVCWNSGPLLVKVPGKSAHFPSVPTISEDVNQTSS